MYGEFCILLDKDAALDSSLRFSDHGSLLETQTQSYRLGSIHTLLRSYELKVDLSDGRLLLFFGDAIYKEKLYQNAQQLTEDEVRIEDFVVKARGSYLLIEVNAQVNTVTLHNDPLSLYPVYWFENDHYAALSNVPIWMETILGEVGVFVERDGLLAGYDLAIGTGAFGVTGWSEFQLIPFSSSAIMTQSKLSFQESRSLDRFFNTNKSLSELIEQSAAEIQENIKAIAESNYQYKVNDITGGMDSRLVLSAIFSQGLEDKFLYHTNGEYPVPDANCALSIMERFDLTRLKIKSDSSDSVATNPIGTFKRFIYQAQGSRFIYDRAFESSCVQYHLIKVGGGLAGGFKSTYSRRLLDDDQKKLNISDAVSSMFLPAKSYLSETLITRLERELHAEFSMLVNQYDLTLRSVMDFFYVLSRNRYFIGIGEFPNSAIRPKVHALYSESLIAAAMMLTDDERTAGKLHYELMKKLSPELWQLPFSEQAWSKSLLGENDSISKLEHMPITAKSNKLYDNVRTTTVCISSALQNKKLTAEENKFDKKWREKQRALGRNWMWRNFDIIHSSAAKYVAGNFDFIDTVIKREFIDNFFNKKHSDFKHAADLRAVLNILILYLFYTKSEDVSRVLYR